MNGFITRRWSLTYDLSKWQRKLVRSNCDDQVGWRVFELGLAAASVVIQSVDNGAVGRAVSARHLVVHATVHATVFIYLYRRAVWTIVVVISRKRHRAGLQGQIQPDGHKQAQGASAPQTLALSDAEQVTQVIVSDEIVHNIAQSRYRGYCQQYLFVKCRGHEGPRSNIHLLSIIATIR